MEENKLPYNNYVVPTRRMSASEIAEMVNSHSDRLLDVDFGFCTDWYRNVDFMEEVISKVNTTEDIDQLIRLMLLKQGLQTCCDHHPKVCCRVTDERKFAPYVEDLGQILHAVRCRVLHNRDMQREMDEFRRKWCSTQTETAGFHGIDKTEIPAAATANYRMEDLPENIRKHLLLKDNRVYSLFVTTIKDSVSGWIMKHRLQDWNVVRFICRLRGLITRKCPMEAFSLFLEHIGLDNQTNNMKIRKDANSPDAFLAYDNNGNNKFWQLEKDGRAVEELLQDVIDANGC